MKNKKVKQISNCKSFEILKSQIESYFINDSLIETSCFLHKMKVGEITIEREVISFSLPFECWIRFGSNEKNKGLELVSIRIHPKMQGIGIGTMLITKMFKFLNDCLGFIPEIQLECTGCIGNNEGDYLINPIKNQTKFFRKFGFRVTNSKEYPIYVKMELDFNKIKY
jgi:ribosomal protein S18 acetylase RimI-like enzyme